MKDTQLITTDLQSFDCTISPDAQKRKDDALALAADIKTVSNSTEQQDAIVAASLLRGLVNGMEKTRKDVKQPVLDAGRVIDDCAELYSGTLERELKRVEGLASAWQAVENKRLETLRLEQERKNAEEAAAADAERKAYLAIIAKSEGEAKEAAQKAADEAAERNAEAARARQTAVMEIPKAGAEGARVTTAKDFEVLDEMALAVARPDLVKIEPRRAMILTAIQIPGANIPGIRVFETTKVQAKAIL